MGHHCETTRLIRMYSPRYKCIEDYDGPSAVRVKPFRALQGYVVKVGLRRPDGCLHCGGRIHWHGRGPERETAHSWVGARWVRLCFVPERYRCQACGRTFSQRLPNLAKWERMTLEAKETALVELRKQSFSGVAERLGIGSGVLRRLVDRYVPTDTGRWWDQPGDLVLSVDEHSFRGMELCLTVCLRWPQRRLLTILPDDRQQTFEAWLKTLPEQVRQRIVAVTVDLKPNFIRIIARCCPNADLLPDPFHLIRDATSRVDAIRRIEQAEAKRPIPRWPVVKGEEKLNPRQQLQLEQICTQFPWIGHLHRLKENLRTLLKAPTRDEAEQLLSRWLINAESCQHLEGHVGAQLIHQWRPHILSHWNHSERFTNGFIEGVHTRVFRQGFFPTFITENSPSVGWGMVKSGICCKLAGR